MKSLLEMCEYNQNKLGRSLDEKEIEFLKWVYKRHTAEQCMQKSPDRDKVIICY